MTSPKHAIRRFPGGSRLLEIYRNPRRMKTDLKPLIRRVPGGGGVLEHFRDREARRRVAQEFQEFINLPQADDKRLPLRWEDRWLCLDDNTETTTFDRHYVLHTAWAARVLAETRPRQHIDVASSLYFISIVSAFMNIEFRDYRPVDLGLSGLKSGFGDLLALPYADDSVPSLSCMHVVEHMGLGRYSDPLDPDGDLKAIQELKRVLASRGALLFVVPLGTPRIQWNAHRIYSYEQIRDYFSDMELEQFALIPDRAEEGNLLVDADPALVKSQTYACGCFLFRGSRS